MSIALERPMLRLRLLGSPQVTLGSAALRFTRRSALALLTYLAVTGQPHTREALAALLTYESSPEHASMHLRNALVDLNRQLGDYLVVTRQAIAFNQVGPAWVDVRAFKDGLAKTKGSEDPDDLHAAVDLYHGEFLAGFTLPASPDFESWAFGERDRLHHSQIQALRRLLDQYAARSDFEPAIAVAQRLLQLDPWDEETHRRLMIFLARDGLRSAALAHYETYQHRLKTELNVAPLDQTVALYKRLQVEQGGPPHNLLPAPTPFIGRARELDVLVRHLADPAIRLITVAGLPGVGKTRLALEAARHYASQIALLDEHPFPDGVYTADLASVALGPLRNGNIRPGTERALAAAVAATVGLTLSDSATPTAQVLAYLRTRHMLLMLDNFEALLPGAHVLTEWLAHAPHVTFLVTSRVRLRLDGEWMLALDGLSVPSRPEEVEQAEASQLFLQQAAQAMLGAPLGPSDYPAVVRIAQLTHGLPLALILAATWLPTLPCVALADDLAANLDHLADARGALPARQRSLQAVMGWTWQQLTPSQQQAVRRLTVFETGFDVKAAYSVAGVDVAELRALHDRGLLGLGSDSRHLLHPLVRQFAARHLQAHPVEAAQMRHRHAVYYATLVQVHALAPEPPASRLAAVQAELPNVQAAWAWAVASSEVGPLAQMHRALAEWAARVAQSAEGRAFLEHDAPWVRSALAETPDVERQAALGELLVEQAALLIKQQQYAQAMRLLKEAGGLAYAIQNDGLAARALFHQAEVYWSQGDRSSALTLFESALKLGRRGNSNPPF